MYGGLSRDRGRTEWCREQGVAGGYRRGDVAALHHPAQTVICRPDRTSRSPVRLVFSPERSPPARWTHWCLCPQEPSHIVVSFRHVAVRRLHDIFPTPSSCAVNRVGPSTCSDQLTVVVAAHPSCWVDGWGASRCFGHYFRLWVGVRRASSAALTHDSPLQ